MDLANALRCRLSYAQSAILEREAPTHFVVPSGSRIPIDYLDGEVPTLSVRLQELFGMRETPGRRRRPAAAIAEAPLAGGPAGADHPRPREFLEARIS